MSKRSVNLLRRGMTPKMTAKVDTITASGDATVKGDLKASKLFHDVATSNGAPTALSATELSVNTHYEGTTATALAMTIPSAAAGNIGDYITVIYTTAISTTVDHSYTATTDTTFALGSMIRRVGGAVDSSVDLAIAGDAVLTLTGLTNGDGGIGTMLKFVNMTGATNGWAVECTILNQGNGSAASASAFS